MKKNIVIVLLILSLTLSSCSWGNKSQETKNNQAISLVDQMGREIVLKEPAKRIVSSYYISSALLISLACSDKLVGIEKKADTRKLYKLCAPEFLDLPAVGSGKGINVEEIAKLEPDLVIIPARLKKEVEALESIGINVMIVNPESYDDLIYCIDIIAKATGTDERGQDLIDYYNKKIDEISKLVEDADRPSVYFASSSDPFKTISKKMFQDFIISKAGGKSVSSELIDEYWTPVSSEQLAMWNPDYFFFVNSASYTEDDIKNTPALSNLKAVNNDRIYRFPSSIESWDVPSPSSILGILYMTHILHPDLYGQDDYLKEARAFYKEFFNIDVEKADLGL